MLRLLLDFEERTFPVLPHIPKLECLPGQGCQEVRGAKLSPVDIGIMSFGDF